jgi:hypothetical protein
MSNNYVRKMFDMPRELVYSYSVSDAGAFVLLANSSKAPISLYPKIPEEGESCLAIYLHKLTRLNKA